MKLIYNKQILAHSYYYLKRRGMKKNLTVFGITYSSLSTFDCVFPVQLELIALAGN
jgi:hypothetical protein